MILPFNIDKLNISARNKSVLSSIIDKLNISARNKSILSRMDPDKKNLEFILILGDTDAQRDTYSLVQQLSKYTLDTEEKNKFLSNYYSEYELSGNEVHEWYSEYQKYFTQLKQKIEQQEKLSNIVQYVERVSGLSLEDCILFFVLSVFVPTMPKEVISSEAARVSKELSTEAWNAFFMLTMFAMTQGLVGSSKNSRDKELIIHEVLDYISNHIYIQSGIGHSIKSNLNNEKAKVEVLDSVISSSLEILSHISNLKNLVSVEEAFRLLISNSDIKDSFSSKWNEENVISKLPSFVEKIVGIIAINALFLQ